MKFSTTKHIPRSPDLVHHAEKLIHKLSTVDGWEIPNNQLGCKRNLVNNGINYQPQLVQDSSINSINCYRTWAYHQPTLQDIPFQSSKSEISTCPAAAAANLAVFLRVGFCFTEVTFSGNWQKWSSGKIQETLVHPLYWEYILLNKKIGIIFPAKSGQKQQNTMFFFTLRDNKRIQAENSLNFKSTKHTTAPWQKFMHRDQEITSRNHRDKRGNSAGGNFFFRLSRVVNKDQLFELHFVPQTTQKCN